MKRYRPAPRAVMKWRKLGPLHIVTHGDYAAFEISIGVGERWLSVLAHTARALLELEAWGNARFWPLSARVKIGKHAL